jgi:hypothetical protein
MGVASEPTLTLVNAIIHAHKEPFHAIAWESALGIVFLGCNQPANLRTTVARHFSAGSKWTATNQRGPYVSSRALFGSQHCLRPGVCHSSGRAIVRAEEASSIPRRPACKIGAQQKRRRGQPLSMEPLPLPLSSREPVTFSIFSCFLHIQPAVFQGPRQSRHPESL